jgi:hypothetical protein
MSVGVLGGTAVRVGGMVGSPADPDAASPHAVTTITTAITRDKTVHTRIDQTPYGAHRARIGPRTRTI